MMIGQLHRRHEEYMGEFKGFRPRLNMAGFTAIPNEFFDEVLEQVDNLAELKILLATFRKTYGWISHIDDQGQAVYKQQDAISYSQFGKLTGLSSPSISSGIDRATKDGYIIKVEQGHYGGVGKSSVYQIRLLGDDPDDDDGEDTPPPSNPEPPQYASSHFFIDGDTVYKAVDEGYQLSVPESSKNIRPTWTKADIETDRELDDGLYEKGVEPQDILDDLFGQKSPEEPPKKQKGRSSWKSKVNSDSWNCNDVLTYYKDMFELKFGIPFGHITGKERSNCKRIVDEYGAGTVKKVADYTFQNYEHIQGLPNDFPNFSIFYGWFKSLYQEALGIKAPARGQMLQKEFDEKKHIGKEGVNTW